MATASLAKRTIGEGFQHKETIADGVNGASLIVNTGDTKGKITCTIIAGANTGKFQFTTSPDADIVAETATWQDWVKGDTTGTDYDVLDGPVTGLRGVSVSGEIVVEIVR